MPLSNLKKKIDSQRSTHAPISKEIRYAKPRHCSCRLEKVHRFSELDEAAQNLPGSVSRCHERVIGNDLWLLLLLLLLLTRLFILCVFNKFSVDCQLSKKKTPKTPTDQANVSLLDLLKSQGKCYLYRILTPALYSPKLIC